jgi:hypothetical protein
MYAIAILPISLLFAVVSACFFVSDKIILEWNILLKFEEWEWYSVSLVGDRVNLVSQFKFQMAVFASVCFAIICTLFFALFTFLEEWRSSKSSSGLALKSLGMLIVPGVILFGLPGVYVGGSTFGFGLQNVLIAIPFLVCIGVWTFLALANLYISSVNSVAVFFRKRGL